MNAVTLSSKNKINGVYCIYFFAAVISVLLSIWMAYRETIINPDAICYLQSAGIIGAGGLRKAMNLCPQAQWPLYSVLIYFISHFTHLSLLTSAYVLDTLFSAMSVVTFIAIVRQLGGSLRVLWLAAFVILLAHEFNSVRQYIVRDHGFMPFYLISISLLLRYVTAPRWYYAAAWGASLLAATLFRIEGIVFLMLLPWTVWFYSSRSYWQRTKSFLQLNFVALSAGIAVFGWLIFHPEISLASLGRMQEFVFQLFHAGGMVWQRFQESAHAFAHSALTTDSMPEATLVFVLTVFMWYLVKIVIHFSAIYSGLAMYGFQRKSLRLSTSSRLVLYGYLFTNILITSLFLAEHLFLSKRYLIALSLVLMVWVPFALDDLIHQWQAKKISYAVVPSLLVLIMATSLGGIFDFGYSKNYMRQAGDWLAENVAEKDMLYSNDYQIMYYSKHFGNDIFQKIKEYSQAEALAKGRWQDYDYIALRFNKKELSTENTFIAAIKQPPVKVFSNKRGDQVSIYKIEY